METTLLTLPELLKSYVDNVMATTAFEGVSIEAREAFRKNIEDRVSEEVMKIVLEQLSEEDFQKLIAAIEGETLTPEEEARMIDEAVGSIPEFSEKLVPALVAIRPEFVLLASEPTSL